MRIMVVHPGPNFSVADVYAGWVEALRRTGHTIMPFNLDDALCFYDNAYMRVSEGLFRKAMPPEDAITTSLNHVYAKLYVTDPDILFVITGFLIPDELLDLARHRGTRIVVLHTESPYEDGRQAEQAKHVDLNLLNDPTNLDLFPPGTLYMPHAYRAGVHCPGPTTPHYESDFVFVGTAFQSRIDLLTAMDLDGLNVFLGGNWQRLPDGSPLIKHVAHDLTQCMDNEQGVQAYRGSKVGLNLYRREHDDGDDFAGWAMGPREVEMAATGLFFLRDPRPEGDELFPMLPTFSGPEEASELLRWWLAHPVERRDAALAAREAIAPRTFDANVEQLLTALD